MSSNKIMISIVLGTYNQLETLKIVLSEYEKQTINTELFEVIVVDSTSTDGSVEFFSQYKPRFNFRFHSQENKGKAAARNKGVSLAQGDYIIITDADMIPEKTFVIAHYEAQINSKQPTCYEGVTWNMKVLEWPTSTSNLSAYITKNIKPMAKLGWYYFLTGNISFPKTLFLSEKGFNETFLNYGWEDLELGYRLQKKNIPLYYLKQANNYHYHVVTEQEEIDRNVKKGESAKILVELHPELAWFCGLNPISKWIFPKIKSDSFIYQTMKNKWFNSQNKCCHKIAVWFLKEHHYMQGLLS